MVNCNLNADVDTYTMDDMAISVWNNSVHNEKYAEILLSGSVAG